MRVLITGSSGFIGSHLKTKLLEQGHEVRDCDLKTGERAETIIITNAGEWKTQFVIHLAASIDVFESFDKPELYWKNNVENTTRIQHLCAGHSIPLIYASSFHSKKWWTSPYAMTKKVNEETAGSNQVGLRFTTVYGEGDYEDSFMKKLENGTLEYVTDRVRDFIHVSDVVDVITHLMKDMQKPGHPMTGAYDIGTGIGHNVADLSRFAGHPVSLKVGESYEIDNDVADLKPIQEMLTDLKGTIWQHKINVKEYIENGYRVEGL